MKASYKKYILDFKRPSGTSRGVLNQKETWFLIIEDHGKYGIGECGILRGLSADDRPDYEEKLQWVCENISLGKDLLWEALLEFPSIQFGVEMAFLSLQSKDPFVLFPSQFTSGERSIPINGLIWMGEQQFMKDQIEEKLSQNFTCIKLKIGAIDFEKELELLKFIRQNFSSKQIEIRVDANGAFEPDEAMQKLNLLSKLDIHSIEQPIAKSQIQEMAQLCKTTKLPIALDEELIGVFTFEEKENLLKEINPQYIILKPSFIGGVKGTDDWITLAEKYNIGWWITSALESNIGLNAIAQYTFTKQSKMPQGLGTGSLFTNNFDSPLEIQDGNLRYSQIKSWNIDLAKFLKK